MKLFFSVSWLRVKMAEFARIKSTDMNVNVWLASLESTARLILTTVSWSSSLVRTEPLVWTRLTATSVSVALATVGSSARRK